MKIFNTLLLLFTSILSAQNISFETSEGYVTGSVNGQNGWYTTQYVDPESAEMFYLQSQVIVDDFAANGNMSLLLQHDPILTANQQEPFIGANGPIYSFDENVEISFDFYIDQPLLTEYSFNFYTVGQTYEHAAKIFLNNEGEILIAASINDNVWPPAIQYDTTEFNWLPQNWYNLKVLIDFTNNSIEYRIDNELIYTTETFTEYFTKVAFFHNNGGGRIFIDNINVNGDDLGIHEKAERALSVFPNPSTSVINVVNIEMLNNIDITDLNGRTVKSVKVNATEAQINISDLSAGVYMMNIATDKGTTTKKIVKN